MHTNHVSRQVARVARKTARNGSLAELLCDAGHRVMLVCPHRKRPLGAGGHNNATSNFLEIEEGLDRHPAALIGLATDRKCVFDFDPDTHGDITPAIANWRAALGGQPLKKWSSLVVRTPKVGFHGYGAGVEGVPIRTAAGDVPLVDYRGHTAQLRATGYIIAPGNVRPDGRRYEIVKGELDVLLRHELKQPPRSWLFQATFSPAQHRVIAGNGDLRAALDAADPPAWHDVFNHFRAQQVRDRLRIADADAGPLRRQGLHTLESYFDGIAGLREGRRAAVWKAACSLARYLVHGALTDEEVVETLHRAFHFAGGQGGWPYIQGCVARARLRATSDPVPLIARQFREEARHGR